MTEGESNTIQVFEIILHAHQQNNHKFSTCWNSTLTYILPVTFQIDDVELASWQAQIKGIKKWTLEPPPECYLQCHTMEVTVYPGEISKLLALYSILFIQNLNLWVLILKLLLSSPQDIKVFQVCLFCFSPQGWVLLIRFGWIHKTCVRVILAKDT